MPILSTQASHLSVLPKFKAELREREFRAAADAGVTTFASIFHACHRELITVSTAGLVRADQFHGADRREHGHPHSDLYKRLRFMGDIDAVIADTADLIAAHALDLETVRDMLAQDLAGAA